MNWDQEFLVKMIMKRSVAKKLTESWIFSSAQYAWKFLINPVECETVDTSSARNVLKEMGVFKNQLTVLYAGIIY
jgi:hypothetical protein